MMEPYSSQIFVCQTNFTSGSVDKFFWKINEEFLDSLSDHIDLPERPQPVESGTLDADTKDLSKWLKN